MHVRIVSFVALRRRWAGVGAMRVEVSGRFIRQDRSSRDLLGKRFLGMLAYGRKAMFIASSSSNETRGSFDLIRDDEWRLMTEGSLKPLPFRGGVGVGSVGLAQGR